ncbi:uncharacterized protein LOC108624385 [Ceratina calcarata]|uniref:Uncharacterized protein LOC108624385 n=1 Tax=Ceratina calcarata TaxID=156304 RepID=A0AAJ7S0W7_9HYME|nr:uncharacterized protein LOC108624385 [Ceratina calcarata]
MESYSVPPSDSMQALDFTTKPGDMSTAPILDLSCKKTSPTRSESRSTMQHLNSPDHCLNPPPSTIARQQYAPYPDFTVPERNGSSEGRTFTITPPSEISSSNGIRCQPIRNYPDANNIGPCVPQRGDFIPMNIPVPCVPALLPTFVAQNGGINKTTAQILTAVTTTATTTCKDAALTMDGKKPTRPFKAYPKDPLALTAGTAELMYDKSNEAYSEFRKRMLESVQKSNEATNAKMRRVTKSPGLPTSTSTLDDKDAAYWEKRRKNNEAAKRSRDARRAKEDEIAIRAAFLEHENSQLKYELCLLRAQAEKLRSLIQSR